MADFAAHHIVVTGASAAIGRATMLPPAARDAIALAMPDRIVAWLRTCSGYMR